MSIRLLNSSIDRDWETVIKDPKFNWDKFQYVVDLYNKYIPTKAQAEMKSFEDEITGLKEMLKNWPWDPSDAKDKAKLLADSEKIWGIYLKLKDQVSAENTSSGSYGGYKKSKLESYRNN